MIRRRRPAREIPFSFDSFLDVVANVVGIILRLILVTWVGARAYSGLRPPPPPAEVAVAEAAPLPEPSDPLTPELERERHLLAQSQAELLQELKQWQQVHQQHTNLVADLEHANHTVQQLAVDRAGLESTKSQAQQGVQAAALTLAEIQARNQKLRAEIAALKKEPSTKQTLRYRTPISHPLQSEELVFECKNGRVALVDIGAMVDEVRSEMVDASEQLRANWTYQGTTRQIGAFQMRYTVEREREGVEPEGLIAKPSDTGGFRYNLSAYEIVPVAAERGETEAASLQPRSAFRRVADSLDASQTAVTLWVYPDSFSLYRRLRDYLHDHDVTVAGRPLPDGAVIASSRHGTVSRGQ